MKLSKTALFFLFFATSLLASCGRRSQMTQLSDIESYIDARPDSALAAIRDIDTTILRSKAAKAKYALLYAIALDKNYIDTADTHIIKPAVDWYERHGTPEEKLKMFLYLGTEQYNSSLYDQAIVSFNKADEQSSYIEDHNLIGILYSRMAETYTRSFQYVIADKFIDKSINCFKLAQRKGQENLERIIKAQNQVRLMEWEKADSCFQTLIADSTLSQNLKGAIQGYYAMDILYDPSKEDVGALEHFKSAIEYNGGLSEPEQYCAYAYVLDISGFTAQSDSLFNTVASLGGTFEYSYNYWKYRVAFKKKDYKLAHDYLWTAQSFADSIKQKSNALSTANSHREYLEKINIAKEETLTSQRRLLLASSIIGLLLSIMVIYLLVNRKRRQVEEQGRMGIVIDQINDIREEMNNQTRRHAKARFSYLAKLYEMVYHLGIERISNKELYKLVNKEIAVLKKDIATQEEFERLLNEEGDGIMERFRNSFNNLSNEEYRLASLIFAGFDNTTIMMIMDISTLEYTRVKKSRLKQMIEASSTTDKAAFLEYFKKMTDNQKRNKGL